MSWRKEMLPYDNYVVDGMARNMWGTHRSPKNIRPHHSWTGTGKVEDGNYAGQAGAVFARVLGDDEGNLNVPF